MRRQYGQVSVQIIEERINEKEVVKYPCAKSTKRTASLSQPTRTKLYEHYPYSFSKNRGDIKMCHYSV